MKQSIALPRWSTITGLLVCVLGSVALGAEREAAQGDATKDLPSAAEVIGRFVKEIGGKAAVTKLNCQHATGKMDLGGQGITGSVEVFAKRPDKFLMKVKAAGLGEMLQGYDGKTGWSVNAVTGPMLLEGKMLDQVRREAQFDAVLHDASEFKAMETVGRVPFEGKDSYNLKLVRKTGEELAEFYDVKSGLLSGSTEVQETPLGPIPVTAVIGEYRKFGDVLFATKLSQKMGPLTQVMTIETMTFEEIPDSVFDLPAEVRPLVK